jgi:cyclopropane fatty-acyl-phospholipid synthase-like methyltransferase
VNDRRRFAPATQRNREPILAVLQRHVKENARVLEIAAGSGEHALFFAPRLRVADWQPTDLDPEARESIDAWRAAAGAEAEHIRPAVALDVTRETWPITSVDVVVCINMIHIAPWSACEGLIAGAARVLVPDGLLFMYGPYKRGGVHTAPSNEAFDQSLRSRDGAWGVRDLEAVTAIAENAGFSVREVVSMPANNLSVVFARS